MRAFREKHGRAGDDGGAPSTPPHDQNRPEHGRGMTRNGPEHPFRTGKPERRGRDWRPGGDHSDPRDKYKLPPGEARSAGRKRNLPSTRPGDDRSLRTGGPARPRGPKPFGSKPGGDRPTATDRAGPSRSGASPAAGLRLRSGQAGRMAPNPAVTGRSATGWRPASTRDGGKRPLRPGRPFGGKPKGPAALAARGRARRTTLESPLRRPTDVSAAAASRPRSRARSRGRASCPPACGFWSDPAADTTASATCPCGTPANGGSRGA